jgi:hypothetical protein
MNTTIPYLERFHDDLEEAARRAATAPGGAGPRRRRPDPSSWLRWAGAAAAVLVLAWAIGSLPSDGASTKFNQVGSAVGTAGGASGDGTVRQPPADVPAMSPAPVAPEEPGAPDGAPPVDLAKIDRDGTLTLKIDEGSFRDTFDEVIAIAEANGGTLLSSETIGSGAGRLTLRIPAARFDRAFMEVGRLGQVRASTVTGKDVTADFIDLQARLKILKHRREIIFGLYDQATTIPQALQLEGELNEVQLEIDRIQGQLRYLDAQTSISTLKVELSEDEPDVAALSPAEDERADLGEAFSSATDGFLAVVSTMIVGFGYLIPIALLLGVVYAIVTLVRRHGRGAS